VLKNDSWLSIAWHRNGGQCGLAQRNAAIVRGHRLIEEQNQVPNVTRLIVQQRPEEPILKYAPGQCDVPGRYVAGNAGGRAGQRSGHCGVKRVRDLSHIAPGTSIGNHRGEQRAMIQIRKWVSGTGAYVTSLMFQPDGSLTFERDFARESTQRRYRIE
jgi:hypothetical protein